MKNYQNSDYAVNKYAAGIVYRFANQTVEITLEDYLRENPGKTEVDFAELKALSDGIYEDQVRDENRQTYLNVSIHGLAETYACSTPSPEEEFINSNFDEPEREAKKELRRELGLRALGALTDVQRRRYIQRFVEGKSTWKIAKEEGSNQKSVFESLEAAEKKIKKILADG